MGSLLPPREDLLRGDYRSLYLAWLRLVEEEAVEDDKYEPPVPVGMCDDSEPLSAFSNFFEIDFDLIGAAAETSGPALREPSVEDVVAWVKALTIEEKDARLCAAVSERRPALGAELLRRYHDANPQGPRKQPPRIRVPRARSEAPPSRGRRSASARAAREEAEKRRREAE